MNALFLILCLLLIPAKSSPINSQPPGEKENAEERLVRDAAEPAQVPTQSDQSKDLTAQETFYPIGGVWWGVRPWGGWGGWGGYRPWHGWHGPHGPWGHWGGHWGGGRWRR